MRTSGLIRIVAQESDDQLPICEAWGISMPYLLTGRGEMFELQPYCDGLVTLLKQYLSVATFDRKGQQYWRGCLVDE